MIKIKRIVAGCMAAVTAMSMTMSAFAADTTDGTPEQTRETVNIGGYECWEEDGNYYSIVGGEECLIIDPTDLSHLSKDVTIVDVSVTPAIVARGVRYDVDLSDGHTYEGEIDITNGDCTTPVFYRSRVSGYTGFKFKTKYWFSNTYSITYSVDYADDRGEGMHGWYGYDMTITFSLANQSFKPIVLAYMNDFGSLFKATFHKDGSTGEKTFNYWVSAV